MPKRPNPSGAYCMYCKRPLTPPGERTGTSFTFDHVKAQSLGGWKRVPCCQKCNNLKDNLPMEDWFWFIRSFPRWWKLFDAPQQVVERVRQEYRRRAYAKAGLALPG